nr:ATPase family AAA domain-containing protein 5-like isoform X2 [Cherax quadricarinatus]
MGIQSFFKYPQETPSKQIEDKKGLLGYFKIVPRSTVIRNLTENQPENNPDCAEEDEVSIIRRDIEESSEVKDVHKDGRKTDGLWGSSCRASGKTEKCSFDIKEVPVGDENECVNFHKKIHSKLKTSKSEVSHKDIFTLNADTLCNAKEEYQCDQKKSSVPPAKKEFKSSDTPKKEKTNIFAFMMTNRGKQNEILKAMKEQENMNNTEFIGSKMAGQSPNKKQEQDSDFTKEASSCKLNIVQKKGADTEDSQVLKVGTSKLVSGSNAFVLMMANRHGQDKLHSKSIYSDEESEKPRAAFEANTSTDKELNCAKKRKRVDLDSSLQDFDLTVSTSVKNKRKRMNKEFESILEDIPNNEHAHSVEKETNVRNNRSVTTFPDCGNTVPNYCVEERVMQEIVSPVKSISFSDYMKEALERESHSKQGNVKADSEAHQGVGQGIKGKSHTDGKGTDPANNKIKQTRRIMKGNVSKLENDFAIDDTYKVVDSEDEAINKTIRMEMNNQNPGKSHRKRLRKKVTLIDSDDDTTSTCEKKLDSTMERQEDPCNQEDVDCCKKTGISKFFKKISQEERSVERSKHVFTVKADVHATYEGPEISTDIESFRSKVCDRQHSNIVNINKESMSESYNKDCNRSISKRIRKSQELEDLNKIEVLEQISITVSPKKSQVSSLNFISDVKVEEPLGELDAVMKREKGSAKISHYSDVVKENENTGKTKNELTKTSRKVLRASQDQNVNNEKKVKKEVISSEIECCEDQAQAVVTQKKSRKSISKEKQKVQEKGNLEDRNCGKEQVNVRRSLRRKKVTSEVEEENCPEETAAANKVKTSSCSLPSVESISDISFDSVSENDRTGDECTSTKIHENDKENIVKYTSTLIQKPGKLRLRIKRIHNHPQHLVNNRRLSLKKSNIAESQTVQQKAKKLLQKAKGTRKFSVSKRKKARLDNVAKYEDKHVMLVNMALINSDVTNVSSFVGDKKASSKQTRKRKSAQALPKPTDATRRKRKQKNNLRVQKIKKTENETNEENCSRRHRPCRQAAITANKALDEHRKIVALEKGEKKLSKDSRRDPIAKDAKLAPIFYKKSKSPPCIEIIKVVTLSPAKLKARQDFLQSGVPDEIKKHQIVERSMQEEELSNWPMFPEVSHVQQRTNETLWKLGIPEIRLRETEHESYTPDASVWQKVFPYTNCLLDKTNSVSRGSLVHVPTLDSEDIASILAYMKSKNPNFPVYRVFKSYYDMKKRAVELYRKELEKERQAVIVLDDNDVKVKKKLRLKTKSTVLSRSKRCKLAGTRGQEEEASIQERSSLPLWHEKTPHSWTQVFAPKNGKQVIGNTENVNRLKMWLQEWKRKCQAYANKQKSMKKKLSRKDDWFEESDKSSSWDEDEFVNTYLLCGPPGIGKTAAVYALAAELGYRVLEVNASSRRPGRQVMSQLVEATQSHSVSNNSSHASGTVAAMFAAKLRSPSKKAPHFSLGEESQDSNNKDLEKTKAFSLVLFEDIDIVFEEWDDGFISTVNNFMATSKRPIVLTVTQASPSILSRIKGIYEKMEFTTPSEDLIAQHLQLVSLANGYHICFKDLVILVNTNKSDIRQSILDLQLLAISGSSHDRCDCRTCEVTDTSVILCKKSIDGSRGKDLSLGDIFPEVTNIKPRDTKLYKAGVCGKLQMKEDLNVMISALKSNKQVAGSDGVQKLDRKMSWTQMADNISSFLPFPLKKEVNKVKRYPLSANDPLVKMTSFWQRSSWLSLDDDDDDDDEPQPDVIEEAEENVKKIEIPLNVQNASKLCLNSLSNLYDTFTQLDILDSSQYLIHPRIQIKERGWWVRQPTAGLSDSQGSLHSQWAPLDVMNDITHELGQKAMIHCNEEICSVLEAVTAEDWPQLCLTSDSRQKLPSLLPYVSLDDSERSSHWDLMGSIASSLPLVNQLNRSVYLDYFSTLRSISRYDELCSALSKKRRGRRFLSQLAQLGLHISVQNKLKMANAMIT